MRVDVAVIGAGIKGSSVALRLAQAGVKVAVLERGIPGAEASSAAAGILSPGVEAVDPGPFHALCRASLERYPSFVREVEPLSGMSIGFRALGTLEVALDETHAKVLAGRAEKMLRHGLPVEVLDRRPGRTSVRRVRTASRSWARGPSPASSTRLATPGMASCSRRSPPTRSPRRSSGGPRRRTCPLSPRRACPGSSLGRAEKRGRRRFLTLMEEPGTPASRNASPYRT